MLNDPTFREVQSPLTQSQLGPLDPRCERVQFSSPLTEFDHKKLAAFLRSYPSVSLRVYAHYFEPCNLEFLRHYSFLRNFAVDVHNLSDFGGIEYLTDDLESIGLGQTKAKRHSLCFLRRFPRLKSLYVVSHTKDIEVIGELSQLSKLSLGSITLHDLSILRSLRNLKALSISLGGTRNLELLPEVGELRYISLFKIRGLCDLQVLAQVESLENLVLWELTNVTSLPSFAPLRSLRHVYLQTMKGLSDLRPIASAPSLKELIALQMGHLEPEAFRPFIGHPTLQYASVSLGSIRKNTTISGMLALPRVKDPFSQLRPD